MKENPLMTNLKKRKKFSTTRTVTSQTSQAGNLRSFFKFLKEQGPQTRTTPFLYTFLLF